MIGGGPAFRPFHPCGRSRLPALAGRGRARFRRAFAAVALIAVSAGPGVRPLAAQASIRVGPNVQVSAALAREPHFEMQIAADPEHADRLMACSMVWPNDHHTSAVVTYVSFDRGRTWTPTLRVRSAVGRPSWDPACAYGPGGVAYSVSENLDSIGRAFERIDHSRDGGRSWDAPSRPKHGERTFITVDHTDGPRRGWLYLYGAGSICLPGVECRNPDAVFFRASGDRGRTIVHEQLIPASGGGYPIGYGPGVILSNGTLVAPIGEWKRYHRLDGTGRVPHADLTHDGRWANAVLKVFRSRPGRPNWPPATEVDTVAEWFYERSFSGGYLPALAVDASDGPFRDRIYAAWPDMRTGRYEVWFAYSDDEGETWSAPRVINDDRAAIGSERAPDHMQGTVAVNEDGVVGVMWYDRRDRPAGLGWTVRFRASLDGGETFLPSVKVSKVPYDPDRTEPMWVSATSAAWSGPGGEIRLGVHAFNFSGGHTAGLAANAAGDFHPLWVGNSTGVPQLWTATVTVVGEVARNGSPALAPLVDASDRIALRFTNGRYSKATQTLEADLRLHNAGADTVTGPIKVRVLDLRSNLGEVEILDADAGGSGEGAVWDFTALTEGRRLPPGGLTLPKRVRIKVTGVGPYRPIPSSAVAGLAIFDAKVLVGSVGGSGDSGNETPDRDGAG